MVDGRTLFQPLLDKGLAKYSMIHRHHINYGIACTGRAHISAPISYLKQFLKNISHDEIRHESHGPMSLEYLSVPVPTLRSQALKTKLNAERDSTQTQTRRALSCCGPAMWRWAPSTPTGIPFFHRSFLQLLRWTEPCLRCTDINTRTDALTHKKTATLEVKLWLRFLDGEEPPCLKCESEHLLRYKLQNSQSCVFLAQLCSTSSRLHMLCLIAWSCSIGRPSARGAGSSSEWDGTWKRVALLHDV